MHLKLIDFSLCFQNTFVPNSSFLGAIFVIQSSLSVSQMVEVVSFIILKSQPIEYGPTISVHFVILKLPFLNLAVLKHFSTKSFQFTIDVMLTLTNKTHSQIVFSQTPICQQLSLIFIINKYFLLCQQLHRRKWP